MATVVLGAVGSAIGNAVGGPAGAAVGQFIGAQVGTIVDNKLFEPDSPNGVSSRFLDVAVQSSAYGSMIPIVYGQNRIGGNIIWSRPILETATTTSTSSGGGKGGGSGKITQTQTNYSYSVTLAIAICEGEVDEIVRVWADSKVVNLNDGIFRLYKGSETQTPDSLIESIEGAGNTPAYRGLCYVVIEDFPLAAFGNRIPNFTFEVKRHFLALDSEDEPVEELIKSVTLIPGAGEYVYDDTVQYKVPGQLIGPNWVQQGNRTRINQNNRDGVADGLVALDQLAVTLPNVEWVSVVVVWFGDSVDAGDCIIKPGVEFQSGAIVEPDEWSVGSFNRSTARQITLDSNGSPVYGGTPSDASLLRYIQELKSRGYNVMFYPMFFMDTENKPWRGRVTGTASEVSSFFTKTNGYNTFINHYANLVQDDVDAFVIGSELIGLTSVQDVDNSFPAVDQLVSLAATVKTTVGSGVKVTYAADWSEYHHTTGGWYNLDPLWASSNIDMVGIDAYFPLSDAPQGEYDVQALIDGWTNGEGYDWVYTNQARTSTTEIAAAYAWKNIQWWWENTHENPDENNTAWVPESKPIWFTEYGYPSVDGAANQPNVFYDPNSSESALPYHSKGRIDFRAQRTALTATEKKWQNSSMIERMFVWTWEARPFPFWPDLTNVWADGALWQTGHWIQGKLGISSLGAIVSDLSQRTGLTESQIDVSRLTQLVDGFVVNRQISARRAIDTLRSAYFFDAVESGGQTVYRSRGVNGSNVVAEADLIESKSGETSDLLGIIRQQELELPQKVDVVYMNKIADYQPGNQHSQRLTSNSLGVETVSMPVVLTNQSAKTIADVLLYNRWLERNVYDFMLPIKYARLEPSDIVAVTIGSATHTIRITNTQMGAPGLLKITGVAEDVTAYDFYNEPGHISSLTTDVEVSGDTVLSILDLPAFPNDNSGQGAIRFAASGYENAWRGAAVFRSDDGGENYTRLLDVNDAAAIGTATTILSNGPIGIFDEGSTVTVTLYGSGTLESKSQLAVLNGANLAKIGNEIIQFKIATLVEPGKYTLSGLLRGRLNTEGAITGHIAGEIFVLLDNRLIKESMPNAMIGLERLYKGVSVGDTLIATASQGFSYQAVSLIPYAPVHIRGGRDESNNLTISWIRRARINGQWQNNVDVPLEEDSEAYEVDILNGSTVVRTLSGLSTPEASYSAAEQTTDFGSAQSSVSVKVYQLSSVVGRGTAGVASV